MDSNLRRLHGLTLSDYEVLVQLANAQEGRLSRVELVERALLSQSGVTRLLEGLERAGLVERASCTTDRRVVYAHLTDQGRAKVEDAARTHLRDVGDAFFGRFSEEELTVLAELLGRLPQWTSGRRSLSPTSAPTGRSCSG